MIVDANVLLYAVDRASRFHASAATWLEETLSGPRRVGLPWPTLVAFVRITTHPRALDRPLSPLEAWRFVDEWLALDNVWIPVPGERHAEVLRGLLARYEVRGNLVADAHLAALGIEHGLPICSADTDFARFREVGWINPIAPS